MLTISNHGSICARCVLRQRILTLQQGRRRNKSSLRPSLFANNDSQRNSPSRRGDRDASSKLIDARPNTRRVQSTPRDGLRQDDQTSPIRYEFSKKSASPVSEQYLGRAEGTGPVRKFVAGHLAQWGLDAASITRRKEQNFRDVLPRRLNAIKEEVKHAPMLEEIAKDVRETDGKEQSFNKLWKSFTAKVTRGANGYGDGMGGLLGDLGGKGEKSILDDLSSAFRTRGTSGLDDRIKYAFYGHVNDSRFTESDMKNQKTLADLRYPTEWYPATRSIQRKIHLHVGPTNSGKTYHALQKLEQAKKGVYAGPLRLLAHEVYTRLNAKGKPCALITGEERRAAENQNEEADMSACTVEMMPLNKTLDVAVIDEIQMIGSSERGWAWTQALLGVKAKEVHLCGEERTVPLLREICASIGEELHIHHYKRLSPLEMAERSLDGQLKKLRKGDCIVSFTVMGIHALRREIEKMTGKKVAIVYGSLPPETRAQQARLFNDPNNDYDFLVASDAVGMGLNLAIKRIIFETASKFDGISRRTLAIADIKQIGGRAGRFRTAAQVNEAPASEQDLAAAKGEAGADVFNPDDTPENVGLVTTLERFDFPIVSSAMQAEPEPILSAGIFPPASVLERFASYFPPRTPFSYILTRLHDISQIHQRFHLCGLRDQVWIADLIEPVQGLTIVDRSTICSCPCSKTDTELWQDLMPAYARCIADQTGGNIVDIKELPLEILESEVVATREYLRELERLHKGVVAYLWLSYRFAGIFSTRPLAFHIKSLVEEKIEQVLGKFSFTEATRRKLAERREKQILEGLMIGSEDQDAEAAPRAENIAAENAVDGKRDVDAEGEDMEKKMERLSEDPVPDDDARRAKSEFEELEPGAELEGSVPESTEVAAIKHRSLTAGGDRFGGEEELRLEEPGMEAVVSEEDSENKPLTEVQLNAVEGQPAPKAEGLAEVASEEQVNEEPKKAAAGGL